MTCPPGHSCKFEYDFFPQNYIHVDTKCPWFTFANSVIKKKITWSLNNKVWESVLDVKWCPGLRAANKACCRESLLYSVGVKHLNKDLNSDASIPICKMMKWDQQEAGESVKKNTTQEQSSAALERILPSCTLKKKQLCSSKKGFVFPCDLQYSLTTQTIAMLMSYGLWISSSPLKIPNPDSLSLDNRPG